MKSKPEVVTQVAEAVERLGSAWTLKKVAAELGYSRSTVWRALNPEQRREEIARITQEGEEYLHLTADRFSARFGIPVYLAQNVRYDIARRLGLDIRPNLSGSRILPSQYDPIDPRTVFPPRKVRGKVDEALVGRIQADYDALRNRDDEVTPADTIGSLVRVTGLEYANDSSVYIIEGYDASDDRYLIRDIDTSQLIRSPHARMKIIGRVAPGDVKDVLSSLSRYSFLSRRFRWILGADHPDRSKIPMAVAKSAAEVLNPRPAKL